MGFLRGLWARFWRVRGKGGDDEWWMSGNGRKMNKRVQEGETAD